MERAGLTEHRPCPGSGIGLQCHNNIKQNEIIKEKIASEELQSVDWQILASCEPRIHLDAEAGPEHPHLPCRAHLQSAALSLLFRAL